MMLRNHKWVFNCILILWSIPFLSNAQTAKWISTSLEKDDTVNVWLAFKKEVVFNKTPKSALARIAVDSKYWLYVNGTRVVFEGGLKRGPNPNDSYIDEIDLSRYLKTGKNTIAIQLWYFGKNGFSHNSSGKPALYFDLKSDVLSLVSDKSWQVKKMKEYKTINGPIPNFRLPESNISYDAREANSKWMEPGNLDPAFYAAVEVGLRNDKPWGELHKRPIPQWKDFDLKEIDPTTIVRKGDTLICRLPYNMQFTPYVELDAPAGQRIQFQTDNYLKYNGSAQNIHAEYISTSGHQSYESLGWINGHVLYVIAPKEASISKIMVRETGYNTEFAGAFSCSDPFFNRLWQKAQRTLYITMRDTYMDCPDRERAQWTGDAVLEAEEAFYALDVNSHALAKKWLHELIQWQKPDGVLYAPVPAGNWDKELPDQVLASIGYYGVWKYYVHTGDLQLLKDVYPKIQKYLQLWDKEEDGLVKLRAGGWQWGDWGNNKDMLLLYNLWYSLAIQGSELMATELGLTADAERFAKERTAFARTFNNRFWRDGQYRDPAYKGKTDDRVHALAVLSGIAQPDQYEAIEAVFAKEEHASPYMEKYVFEAMFKMQIPEKALARHKKRFSSMVNNTDFTTLFEGWGIGNEGFGGGTVNHAWSGGGLTVLSSKLCGIAPLSPGYKSFIVNPQLGNIRQATTKMATVKGAIAVDVSQDDKTFTLYLQVPKGCTAMVVIPQDKQKEVSVKKDGNDTKQYKREGNNLIFSGGSWYLQAYR